VCRTTSTSCAVRCPAPWESRSASRRAPGTPRGTRD
jgi:hypothetical protein